jgi:hypothetical protein
MGGLIRWAYYANYYGVVVAYSAGGRALDRWMQACELAPGYSLHAETEQRVEQGGSAR